MQKDIRHKWFLQNSAENIWEYLTTAELISQWLMPNDFKPVAGHKFMFNTSPQPKMNFDGKIYCEVLEVVPNKRLSYSWKGGPGNGVINLDTIVVWTLNEKENGTELTLEHSGFKEEENFMAFMSMNEGWARIGVRFSELLTKK